MTAAAEVFGVARDSVTTVPISAIQDFEEAIRLNPDYALSHENLGVLYAILAETALTQAQKLDRGNPRLAARIAQRDTANFQQISRDK